MIGSVRNGLEARKRLGGARVLLLVALALCAVGSSDSLAAEITTSVTALGDMTVAPARMGHGALVLALDVDALVLDSKFSVVLDTETLRLTYGNLRITEGVWLSVHAEGEAWMAGLSQDYFREGRRLVERGFKASYVGGGVALTLSRHRAHWVRAGVSARRWFFTQTSRTSADFQVPQDVTVVVPSLSYTFWRVANSSDFHERQRVFPRITGGTFGVEVSTWLRSNDGEWGALAASFEPADARNDPSRASVRLRGWLVAGAWLSDRVRWQFAHRAAFGWGEDDLSRDRIGGLNPYVVPLAGAPWGAYVSERYLSGQWSWHVPLLADHEVGVLVGGAYIDDLSRTSASAAGAVWGAAGFADLRFGSWQTDLRLGWTPTSGVGGKGPDGVSVSFGVGWSG